MSSFSSPMTNQYGGFNFGGPGSAGVATVTQPAMGQPVPMQMAQMSMAFPPNMTCAMSPNPVSLQCPFCQSSTTTSVDQEVGLRAKMTAFALIISGCCCLLPLIWSNLKDSVHYCSNCQKEIGRYVGFRGRSGKGRRR